MCGIAGWLDFARDVTQHRSVAEAMTMTMTRRGPDASGLWLGEHVALGHRRLSVIDLEGGCQPMATEKGSAPQVVLTYSGETYNFQELRSQLQSMGHPFDTRSDTEVVLRAYQEWGAEFVHRLEGIYAFAIWDERRQELVLVRDRMGVKPLYYAITPTGVLFGSEPKAILAHPDFQPVLDADGLRDILSVAKVPGNAIFQGMRELPPGSTLTVNRSGATERIYWRLRIAEHPDSLDHTIQTVRDMLETIVTQQMVADVPLCTLLSGGLDSSSLTALAAKAAREQGIRGIRSCSVSDSDPEHTSNTPANDDHVYARLLADHVGSTHSELPLNTDNLLNPELRASVLAAYDLPIAKGDEHASLQLLFAGVRQHSTVALSGECGDEVFGGYRWQRERDSVFSGTFPWVHDGRDAYRGNGDLFDPDLIAKLDLNVYERDCYSTAIAEIAAREHLKDPEEARYREATYLALTRHAQVLFDRKDRMSMACGLEVRVPFADHKLVEYTFNVPWSMKTFDGREKSLLRASMKDLLPKAVAQRIKAPYPSIRDGAYDRGLRQRLAEVICTAESPIAPLLSTQLRQAVSKHGASALAGTISRAALETALQLDAWLRTYSVKIAL
ncbi:MULTISPECIES: asparagine synthase (glutamine-hydrolyzing) [unclassified Streptomyces]|uniref:asparagine synthase (glutamine-hydrolyzing) n=1 Tax=unclassified Streptomyces TaxID=2593676 RepID=UPI000BACC142|nr:MULTISPECIES: asparagine synthase (glutamine-hydrolyzing) [unclassified Streptomyces]ASY33112.1 asparagine synthase (glutamine-hydrolyzing) [Streptomyces sp. CLI2509]MYX23240.1 asparagine synthase (glutamine-hydrolyzing) [Streptomyces sp. SID8380]